MALLFGEIFEKLKKQQHFKVEVYLDDFLFGLGHVFGQQLGNRVEASLLESGIVNKLYSTK